VVTGIYIAFATIGVFIYFYTSYDWSYYQHPLIPLKSLLNHGECETWNMVKWKEFTLDGVEYYDISTDPCSFFTGCNLKA